MPFNVVAAAASIPTELQLKQVQLIHRHGERTPVNGSLSSALRPNGWDLCKIQPFLHAWHVLGMDIKDSEEMMKGNLANKSVLSSSSDAFPEIPPVHESLPQFKKVVFEGSVNNVLETQVLDQLRLIPPNGTCFLGQLTDAGKDSLRNMGADLRKLYVNHLSLLPPALTVQQQDSVWIRSTDYARTVESVQFLLDGLYPPSRRDPDLHLRIHTRTFPDETMYPHPNCPRLMAFTKAYSRQYGEEHRELVDSTITRFQRILGFPDVPQQKRLKYLYHLYDYMICTQGNGEQLPVGITQEDVKTLEQFAVDQWCNAYSSAGVARLAIGRLLPDFAQNIRRAVAKDETAPKMAIFSGHDTTLSPLLSAFQVFDGTYPGFASLLSIELFEERKKRSSVNVTKSSPLNEENTHFVRVLWNGHPRIMPACGAPQDHKPGHPSFCTVDAFMRHMKSQTPTNYVQECQLETKSTPQKEL